MTKLQFAKIRDVKTPERATGVAAGIDFYVPNDFHARYISPGEDVLIPSGIKVKLPHGFALIAFNKSSLGASYGAQIKAGLTPSKNALVSPLEVGACVIDEDYQGEIHLSLRNAGTSDVEIKPGQKIVQFVMLPVCYSCLKQVAPSELYDTETRRGQKGFGSSTK